MILYVVGIGPGHPGGMTLEAKAALEQCGVIAGYTVYTALLELHFPEKEYYSTAMRQEEERCRWALSTAAAGRDVALVCSGDAGIYGMAGLLYQLRAAMPEAAAVEIRVIPGVTAASSGAALLGAPLTHDFAVISLSDLLTDAETIWKRVRAAADSGMIICLYNPASRKRKTYLRKACDLILEYRRPETVCGYVRNIGREGETSGVLTLAALRDFAADMFTTIYIGNDTTVQIGGHMVTPRGYPAERRQKCAVTGRIVIFGGTSEGTALYRHCIIHKIPAVICVATAYGAQVLRETRETDRDAPASVEIRVGRLTAEEMERFFASQHTPLVLDATHPFAQEVTENIRQACAASRIPYRRVRRVVSETDAQTEQAGPAPLIFDSIGDAVLFLKGQAGNILATTGSRDICAYTALPDFRERLYVRVLPEPDTIRACMDLGITGRHLSAMQGPFTEAMNYGFLKEFAIRWLVTKQSGGPGGFYEKRSAAMRAGAGLIEIRKPDETGITLSEAIAIMEGIRK